MIDDTMDDAAIAALENVKLAKLQKKINAENWTPEIENLLKSWGEKAAGNRELHMTAAHELNSLSMRLYLPNILFSTVSGMLSFGSANTAEAIGVMYTICALNISSALLTSIIKLFNPDQRKEAHINSAKRFGSFYRHISLQLSLSREDRTSTEILSEWATTEFDRIQTDAPDIPTHIIDKYKVMHANDVNKPDVAMDSFDILVHKPDTAEIPTGEVGQVVSHA